MGILTNPRHELFAQELAKGKSATEAYTLAGYKPCRQNAARLTTNDDIRTRLAEIQSVAAKTSEVTVASLLAELEHARSRADSLDQLGAAVKAISEKAKISGLLVQRVEVSDTNRMTLDDENTSEDVAIHFAKERGVVLSPKELEAFMRVIRGWYASMEEFLASCEAKQVHAVPAPVEIERRRLALASRNGR